MNRPYVRNLIESELCNINDFKICYFKDIDHDASSPPHYYLCVPVKGCEFVLLCMITSQVQKIKFYRREKNLLNYVVELQKNALSFLDKDESVIDCNKAELIEIEDFVNKIALYSTDPLKIKYEIISEDIKKRVINAIMGSPEVEKITKKSINYCVCPESLPNTKV